MDEYVRDYPTFQTHIVFVFGLGDGGLGDFVKYFVIVLSFCKTHKIAAHCLVTGTHLEKHVRLRHDWYVTDVPTQRLDALTSKLTPHVFYGLSPQSLYTCQVDKSFPYSEVFTFSDAVLELARSFHVPDRYTSIHLRMGDKFLETDKKFVLCVDDQRSFREEDLVRWIERPNVVFFCDNYAYKMKIKSKCPQVYVTDWPVAHSSLANTTEEQVMYAVAEYVIMTRSVNIIAASKSGFSKTSACFHRIPYHIIPSGFALSPYIDRGSNEQMARIAILAETKWALGRIYKALERVLRVCGYDVSYFDTYVYDDLDAFRACHHTFDVIIGHSASVCCFFGDDLNESNAHKFLLTVHSPVLNNPHFSETVSMLKDITYTSSCQTGVQSVQTIRGGHVFWTPFGADLTVFPMNTTTPSLKRAGFIGHGRVETTDAYTAVKRPNMFAEICRQAQLDARFIYNQPSDLGALIYKDLDVLICCSTYESGPLGVFEAAALGIPVLTTAVGNSQRIPGLKVFSTVDEAVAILQRWKHYPNERTEYAAALQTTVRTQWSMDACLRDHMIPVVQHILCKQSKVVPVYLE
jgi:hypothetical protein